VSAMQIKCLNNLKRIHLVGLMYSDDNNDKLAPNQSVGGSSQ